MTASVVRVLASVARTAAHRAAPRGACPACGAAQDGETLADRPDGTVVRHGSAVAKAHAPGTDPVAHRARLALAAHPALAGVLLPPLPHNTSAQDRPVTTWPYGAPVDPGDPDAAPWEDAAVLLARLHRVEPVGLAGPLPPMRGPAKAAAAVARMEAAAPDHPAARDVRRAWAGLPGWARGEEPPAPVGPTCRSAPRRSAPRRSAPRRSAVCHGDLHLGQLVRHPAPDGPWLLIDVDDLGLGDPAWDLARPAAWFAAGLLPPEVWQRFLGAYTAAGGPAVASVDDPWPQLDVPARALTVQTAALALAKAAAQRRRPDAVEGAVLDACARIGTLAPELEFEAPS